MTDMPAVQAREIIRGCLGELEPTRPEMTDAILGALTAAGIVLVRMTTVQSPPLILEEEAQPRLEDFEPTLQARIFAERAHGAQRYGRHPYVYHLNEVVKVLGECGVISPIDIQAGWLHDVVEDTGVNLREITLKFGSQVSDIVWACSGFGKNRRERNADIHSKLIAHSRAIGVKVADRIANVENGLLEAPEKLSMYVKEAEQFEDLARGCMCAPALYQRLRRAHDLARDTTKHRV